MANLRFFGATFFKSFVRFFLSLHIKVKYLYIRKYTTAMDFCGDRPPRVYWTEKNTNDVTDGKGERERERVIAIPCLSWVERKRVAIIKPNSIAPTPPHTHDLGRGTHKQKQAAAHLGYKCFHCSSSEARDDHWQWAKIVALLPESRQQQDAFCQARLARVLPYIFYCSRSWKEMKIVLCGYAKKYAMRFFTGHAQQQRQLPRKKFK